MVTQKEVKKIMLSKIGRPTENPKKNNTRIRMSDEDIEILEQCVKITGKSKSDIIREGIRLVYAGTKK